MCGGSQFEITQHWVSFAVCAVCTLRNSCGSPQSRVSLPGAVLPSLFTPCLFYTVSPLPVPFHPVSLPSSVSPPCAISPRVPFHPVYLPFIQCLHSVFHFIPCLPLRDSSPLLSFSYRPHFSTFSLQRLLNPSGWSPDHLLAKVSPHII